MRCAGLLVVVAGCGFRGAAAPAEQPPSDAAAADGAGAGLDAAPADAAPPSPFCAIDGVVACFEFEGTAANGSGHALQVTASGVSFQPGKVNMAMQVNTGSVVTVPGNALFNVDAVTIEAWVRPAQLPTSKQQFDLLDVDNQYALYINDTGTVTCDLHGGPGKFTTTMTVPTQQWTHIACSYDANDDPHIYFNGNDAATGNAGGTIEKHASPMGIAQNSPSGSQLVGLIDQLRLLNVGRTGGQICQDAGGVIDPGDLLCVPPPPL